jgi:predicted outer membrane repeat protein
LQGGGIYSKGLQQDSLGAFGALIINHTIVINNTASFGGGIACDSCRAILAAQIDGNQAIRNVSLDNATSSGWAGGGVWGGEGSPAVVSPASSGCSNGTGGGTNAISPMRRLRHAVLGAGGGIAANLAGNSYVIICVSGNGSSIDRGNSTLRNNRAEALGGAVYLNTSMIAPDCLFPQPGPALTETCFPGGYWPKTCGFNTLDLDWQGSMAVAGGDLVAWAGDTSGFNQACTLTGAVCDVNNVTLQSAGVSRVFNTSSSNSVAERGSKGNGTRSSVKKQKTCVRTFDAAAAFVCSAGSGLGGKQVKLVDDTRKFQLPASFFVFVSDCVAFDCVTVGGGCMHKLSEPCSPVQCLLHGDLTGQMMLACS